MAKGGKLTKLKSVLKEVELIQQAEQPPKPQLRSLPRRRLLLVPRRYLSRPPPGLRGQVSTTLPRKLRRGRPPAFQGAGRQVRGLRRPHNQCRMRGGAVRALALDARECRSSARVNGRVGRVLCLPLMRRSNIICNAYI
ncbi:hypothetical protein Pyn_06033 [Prunus yedoensis var. nudiflora]|uniref:Uncharacterized protein n=1 Tax=Prunus yedoensis var. nudiflora TaxID=2094558 RepID=A0A314ZAT7_PRUYE|nr:hypothetical protein Pyn_06033 [Prunus yedoensis var. nudiflora]